MTEAQRVSMLMPPKGIIHAVIDTDPYNEVDDQFTIAYLAGHTNYISLDAVYAAPFLNDKVSSPKEGMERSFEEAERVLSYLPPVPERRVLRGSDRFMAEDKAPVRSEAVEDLIQRARLHNSADPLYVIGIAAATDIASAILLAPDIIEQIVVVWLGGSALHRSGELEFNMMEDQIAAQILFDSGVPLVQVPCWGLAEHFTVSQAELNAYLVGKNPLADYLAKTVIEEVESYTVVPRWSKTIWDVVAAAWLTDQARRMTHSHLIPAPIPHADGSYAFANGRHLIRYVDWVERDLLMNDLFDVILKEGGKRD